MSLFSSLRKNKQESASDDSTFYSRAEEESGKIRGRAKRRQGNTGKRAESADPVLPEKKRARRRLVGAIALVLAAVVGLPMILDSEPRPVADDIAIQIPARDKLAPRPAVSAAAPAATKIAAAATLDPKEEELIDPPADAVDAKGGEAASDAVKPAVATGTTVAMAKPQARTEPRAAADPGKAGAAEKPHAPPVAKTDSKSEHKSEHKPEHKTADRKPDETVRALALLEGKGDSRPAEKKPEKFVIQVAALATREKVDELQSRLRDAGIQSYTQKVATASGDRIRIRVGPFVSKDEAEKARAKIVKLGLSGTLVPA